MEKSPVKEIVRRTRKIEGGKTTPKGHPMENPLYQQIIDLPPGLTGQIIDGEVVAMSRPRVAHQAFLSEVPGLLDPFKAKFGHRGKKGEWWILTETEVQFEPEKEHYVPDLSGWRVERLPELPDVAFMTLAPDWVCEVLSDSSAKYDRGHKFGIYAKHGVSHCWIADANKREVEVYALEAKSYVRAGTFTGAGRIMPFDGKEIDLSALWLRSAKK